MMISSVGPRFDSRHPTALDRHVVTVARRTDRGKLRPCSSAW